MQPFQRLGSYEELNMSSKICATALAAVARLGGSLRLTLTGTI